MVVVAEPAEFPDVELLVRLYLRQVRVGGEPVVVTDEPRNPLDPPVLTVLQLPGPGPARRRGWETVRRVETASLGVSRAESRSMSEQIETLMVDLSGGAHLGVLVDRVTQNTAPGQVPYAPDVRRIPIVWDITVRRHKGERVTVDA